MVTWINALGRTRQGFLGRLKRFFSSDRVDDESREALEESLLQADVSMALIADLMPRFEKAYRDLRVSRRTMLAGLLEHYLAPRVFTWDTLPRPCTILVVGINGSGKTTTCAKLAHRARAEGRIPLLGAGDTFRAAGADQLRLWGRRLAIDTVAGATGADAAAVAYDALDAALARNADLLVLDTAGRMHTRQPLMQELVKVRRALAKRRDGAPEETWIILDATLGRNAVHQARQFHEAVPLTGAVVTKLDGSSKAGFVFSIAQELQIPVLFAGLGEGEDDLVPFDGKAFSRALLGLDDQAGEVDRAAP